MQAISYAILKSRVKSHIDTHFLDNRLVVLNTQLFGAQFRKQFIDQNNKASLTRTLLNLTFEACSSKPRYRLDKSILRNKLQLKRIFHHYPVQPTVEFNTVTYRFSCYICFYSFFQCFVFFCFFVSVLNNQCSNIDFTSVSFRSHDFSFLFLDALSLLLLFF